MLVGDLHGLLALERLLTGQHLEHHDADRVDVAAGVGDAAGDEFGGEVRDRAEQRRARCRIRRCRPRQPEVTDLDATVVRQQHVLRFEITMDDAGLVRGSQAGEHRLGDVDGLLAGQRAILLHQIAEGDAGEVLHHQVCAVGILSLVEDVDDVRMRKSRGRAGFLDEALLELAVVGKVSVHDLHGDAALEPQVGGKVDRRHAAAGDS